jgi:single-strand DNA-binding protein
MASVNKAILVGNLGKDPELRYTASGTAICTFSLATTEHWTDQSGQRQEKTEWHRITVWKKLGENCAKYLKKGRSVYVEGKIETHSWEDPADGKTRYSTEIVAEDVKFLGSAHANGQQETPQVAQA